MFLLKAFADSACLFLIDQQAFFIYSDYKSSVRYVTDSISLWFAFSFF